MLFMVQEILGHTFYIDLNEAWSGLIPKGTISSKGEDHHQTNVTREKFGAP